MRSHLSRRPVLFLESLEGRNAPSSGLSGGLHHALHARPEHAGRPAHVQHVHATKVAKPAHHGGADDGVNHNIGDPSTTPKSGVDDGVNHDAGNTTPTPTSGADDGVNHDAGNTGSTPKSGADDGANHNVGDDNHHRHGRG